MPLWIPITITAALFQCWRTAMQQKLRGLLSVNGAAFIRFLYGAPVAVTFFLIALAVTRTPLPAFSWRLLLFAAAGGLTQIIGTNLLIMAFGFRNFAVGSAYAKTEAMQTGLVALVVLHEQLRPLAWAGIGVGVIGVLTLSLAGRGMRAKEIVAATVQPAALCGLGAGLFLGTTGVLIKIAAAGVPVGSLFVRALFVLTTMTVLQTLMQGSYLAWRDPEELRKAAVHWRRVGWVGLLSACGSACWFTGFTLTDVALVRALGQIEVVFTLIFSRFYLKERLKPGDATGLILVVAGVLMVAISSG
ncbi:MAG: EamA family transporter [Rhodospirillales bacterium]|jgi:drug/metabolite transporter (DMT)-like permease|nr:EamA family transporter [Rhodospirillales bacterium]